MIDNPNGITIDDTVVATWFERGSAHVALWMKDEDGEQGQELIADWRDEDVFSLVEDGFLDGRDWHGSAFEYAASLGRLNPANRVETERVPTGWVLLHEDLGAFLGWERGPEYIWSGDASAERLERGAHVFADEEHAVDFVLEDMPEDEAEELREKLSAFELPLDVCAAGQSWASRISIASIAAAGLLPDPAETPAL